MIIDKNKFVLVNAKDQHQDKPLKTKEIGYYKDSWNRFKKNKGAFVAFYIIAFILLFVGIGPSLKSYDLPRTQPNLAF